MDVAVKTAKVGSDTAKSETAGFTLIELLVVVAVVALLAVGASLVAMRKSGQDDDAQRFAETFDTQRQRAVQGQETRGLRVTARGITIARAVEGRWEEPGRETLWRGRVAFALTDSPLLTDAPDILFLSNGRTSAFSIRFGGAGGRTCQSDGWSGLICSKS